MKYGEPVFTWKKKIIFFVTALKEPEKNYLVTYNFEQQSLTYIGKVDKRFSEFDFFGHKSIEYKDEVYFIAVNIQDDVRLRVGKLYGTIQQEEIIFEKIADHIIPKQSFNIRFIVFIKDDVLCIYFHNEGLLMSMDLQDEQAVLQQHQSDLFASL